MTATVAATTMMRKCGKPERGDLDGGQANAACKQQDAGQWSTQHQAAFLCSLSDTEDPGGFTGAPESRQASGRDLFRCHTRARIQIAIWLYALWLVSTRAMRRARITATTRSIAINKSHVPPLRILCRRPRSAETGSPVGKA
jgi:hypothetical protein